MTEHVESIPPLAPDPDSPPPRPDCDGIQGCFPNAFERQIDGQSFLEITRRELKLLRYCDKLGRFERALQGKLTLIHGVGPKIQRNMQRRGTRSLRDVITSYPQFSTQARALYAIIRERRVEELACLRYCRDIDLLYAFAREDLLFLDVEGLGFFGSPLFLVGVGFFTGEAFEIRQFLARNYKEEQGVCQAVLDLIPRFRTLVTFNGKAYDVSILRDRCLYFFERDPLLPDPDRPASFPTGQFHHIDLYHNARRAWRGHVGPSGPLTDFRLGTLEQEVLGIASCRDDDIPSHRIPRVYESFIENPADHLDDMKQIIQHNYLDVRNLVILLERLARELLNPRK